MRSSCLLNRSVDVINWKVEVNGCPLEGHYVASMDKAPLHEDFLKREDEKGKWVEYWVVLKRSVLYFYDDQTDLWHDYCDRIEITPGAKCSAVRRKTYSYRFKLITSDGSWLLKCQTNLQRHRWMHAIDSSARGISLDSTDASSTLPFTPCSCYEVKLFGRSLRREMRQREAAAATIASREIDNFTQVRELSVDQNMKERHEASAMAKKCKTKVETTPRDKQTGMALKTLQYDGVTSSTEFGSPLDNPAFSDDEVSVHGREIRHNSEVAPIAKFICVKSASELST